MDQSEFGFVLAESRNVMSREDYFYWSEPVCDSDRHSTLGHDWAGQSGIIMINISLSQVITTNDFIFFIQIILCFLVF